MRIGVNALYLIPGGVGGTEIYLRCLLGTLAEIDGHNEYVIFTNRETDPGIVPRRPNFTVAPQPVRAVCRPWRILWEQTGLPLAVRSRRVDVLFNPGFTSPVLCPAPTVTVFHDLQHKRHPENFRWFDLPFWRLLLWAAAHRSRTLVAVSEATRADLLRYYRISESKIRVVPHGVEEQFFEIGQRRGQIQPEPCLLAVSTLHPHKNLDRLVRVFARFRRSHPAFRLVIAGMRGFYATELERLIAGLGAGEVVRLTGWLPREELADLYLRAWAYINPTLFEGFGMPVLEALAAGIPTACSSIEPLRSVAGDAALLFDPLSDDALLDAMVRIASDEPLRQRLAQAGPRRAAVFTWRKAAQATLGAFREAATRDLRR
ncbi:MAG TPA: glycosyltransferase family 1 protein [Bryobacteraceae bacterium]|nr:glycosyltransferase family 1 protein [Bryobacteraceae bacterium]